MTELQSKPPVLDNEKIGEIRPVITLARAIITSISVFVLLMILPVGTLYVIPEFKTIFADMLSDHLIVSSRIFLVFAVICAGFLGFQQMFLPRNYCKLLHTLFAILFFGIIAAGVIAMFLPVIK